MSDRVFEDGDVLPALTAVKPYLLKVGLRVWGVQTRKGHFLVDPEPSTVKLPPVPRGEFIAVPMEHDGAVMYEADHLVLVEL